MSYVFWCSRCRRDHAGECQSTTSPTGRWPLRAANGQRFRWANGIHTIVDVNDDQTECTLHLYGDPYKALFGWAIIDRCRPAGCIEFIS